MNSFSLFTFSSGTCVDGFLFGSCCTHNETLNQLDSGGSTPVKPYYSNSISAAYHSEHEPFYTTTNLDTANSPNSSFTSYVNFNNNPPSDNDVYHIHHEFGPLPVQPILSTTSTSSVPPINLSFLPASSGSTASIAPSSLPSSNHHNNLNHHHYLHSNRPASVAFNGFNNLDNDDHRRPHTHNQHSNHSGAHFHHHNYENFLLTTNGDQSSGSAQLTTTKPSVHSFINFNQTNSHGHPIGSSSIKPNYKPTSFQAHSYSTTILPPIVMNYNPFKPANHTFLIKNNSTSLGQSGALSKPGNNSAPAYQLGNNNLVKPAHSSAWNSFYKPWSNKPTNGRFCGYAKVFFSLHCPIPKANLSN